MSETPLKFLDSGHDLSLAMSGTFDPLLVVLSILVASVAAYSALLITERVANSDTRFARGTWLALGALAMGSGIWTMHFVGMLAYQMEMPVAYSLLLTALSAVPGVLASGVALHIMRGATATFLRLNVGGILMGGGIGAMHYTGMAAMVMPAETVYDPKLFVLSILVAHVLATISLAVKFRFARGDSHLTGASLKLLASAGIMGCAVAGMHYTAMAAAFHFPVDSHEMTRSLLTPLQLGAAASAAAGLMLAIAIVSSIVDRRMQSVSSELRDSEERTRLILETAGEGIIVLDDSGVLTAFNAAAARIFGYSAEEALGCDVSLLLPDEAPALRLLLESYLENKNESELRKSRELFGKRKSEESFPLLLTMSECVVGGRSSFTGVIHDLSEQRALEARLLQAQKLESIGQLAAGVAHEINTPAQYVSDNIDFLQQSFDSLGELIKAYGELLHAEESGEVPAQLTTAIGAKADEIDLDYLLSEIPTSISQSKEGIDRVTKIVRAMKEFSHPGSHNKQAIDINRAIESTLTVAANEWKYVADLETDFDEDLGSVPCLAAEFNQVILNIVVNAAHAIEAQGVLEQGVKGRIAIRTQRDGDHARIEIEDTGGGMPEDVKRRIFDPFFTTKGVGKGTGQGLSIAHSVVADKHGGTLEVESDLGKGTVFTIRLPLSEPA
ncbi:MAG: ATP-binding protein, partial [Myxococcales bacterium]|nr:ATP-binding protein [Myxococcales bacterium]